MCTVTIIPVESGVRLACNRDESPLRPAALPPRVIRFGARQALIPLDPVAGGTWIAANDAGLIMTLLNYYALPHVKYAPPSRRSRGLIIPGLLDAATLDDAFASTRAIDPADFAAFRLVLADRAFVAEVVHDGVGSVRTPPTRIDGPLLYTSSGLGDNVVGPPRRALFAEFFARDAGPAQQDAFHRHSWADRQHLSVCMRRPDARTVSYTVVEHLGDSVGMLYRADAPDQLAAISDQSSLITPPTNASIRS